MSSKLDDISQRISLPLKQPYVARDDWLVVSKAELKALMLELIGEDDRISGKEHETTLMFREGVNDAKAELRKKVEEL